eukprot:PhM_4_TR3620/c0_g1_i1/m.84245
MQPRQLGGFRLARGAFRKGCLTVPRTNSVPKKLVESFAVGGKSCRLDRATSILPNMYMWLQKRAGVSFKETDHLVHNERLRVRKSGGNNDETEIIEAHDTLLWQRTWDELGASGIEIQRDDGLWVPAAERSLHRTHYLFNRGPKTSMSTDVRDKASFLHRVPAPGSALWCALQVPGFHMNPSCSRLVEGLVVLTTDLTLPSLHSHIGVGSGGAFRVDFIAGTPRHVAEALRSVLLLLPEKDPRLRGEFTKFEVSEVFDGEYAPHLFLTTPLLSAERIKMCMRHSVEKFVCLKFQDIDLPYDMAPDTFREFNGEEKRILDRSTRRNQAQYVSLLCREY